MDIAKLINHPEKMDKETLYELRRVIALYPYYQPARLLMLQNMYILHDPMFEEELKKAAIYITNRRVIFDLIEASHYKITAIKQQQNSHPDSDDRTSKLIDEFLETLPQDTQETQPIRKPTPTDATIDYVSYLLQTENLQQKNEETPLMKGQMWIDNFIYNEGGKIQLKTQTDTVSEQQDNPSETENIITENNDNEGYFTEALAKIYIKQGRYYKALEIIRKLNLNYPKKNAYFADQIRFLEKLIINNNNNNK